MVNSKVPKILVVDDEASVLDALEGILQKQGYEVLSADNAEDALEIRSRKPVDMVIADYRMPGMDGIELLKKVKNRWPDTLRIVLTGYSDFEIAIDAINEANVYRFILKPWNTEELKLIVEQALKYQQAVRSNKKLANELKKQRTVLSKLKQKYPGITHVRVDEKGALSFADDYCDLNEIIVNGMNTDL